MGGCRYYRVEYRCELVKQRGQAWRAEHNLEEALIVVLLP